ncbi:MAG: hypothetical protein IJ003_01115 [Candidatus Gastranaerophilales bacterium]|nr:hypothetical protein [Candidatus Gastranaerophilales bacterium]
MKIKYKILETTKNIDIDIDKLIKVLSILENNDNLKYENKEQLERLMKKYNLFDEYFLKNVNKL